MLSSFFNNGKNKISGKTKKTKQDCKKLKIKQKNLLISLYAKILKLFFKF